MTELERLLAVAKTKPISEPEYDAIARNLLSGNSETSQVASALRLLLYQSARAGLSQKYQYVGEKYLFHRSDPFVASQALILLCSYVAAPSVYENYIKKALKGFSWDFDRDVQISAATISVDLFQQTQDSELICLLVAILRKKDEDRYFYAYEALLKIAKQSHRIKWRDWIETPSEELVDWNFIEKLEHQFC